MFPCPLFCLSLELQTEQAVFTCLLSPSSDWLTALWVTHDQAYHRSHSGAFMMVNRAERHVMFGYIYRRPATCLLCVAFGVEGCWWMRRGAGVVGSEAGLVPAGWAWETSAIPNDSYGGGSTKQDVSITYFLEWTEWKSLRSYCFHTLRVSTNPLQVITDSNSPENVFYTIWALYGKDLHSSDTWSGYYLYSPIFNQTNCWHMC